MTKQEYNELLTDIDWYEKELENTKNLLDDLYKSKNEFEQNNPEDEWA